MIRKVLSADLLAEAIRTRSGAGEIPFATFCLYIRISSTVSPVHRLENAATVEMRAMLATAASFDVFIKLADCNLWSKLRF